MRRRYTWRVKIKPGRMEETDMMFNWGTWEELVLGGAVLRHGNRAWNAVATELRSRTFSPYYFTPEVCKAKYEDLQERYSGCTSAWFEELKKERVAQLKRELEKSEGSIGSLQSKLESLKSGSKEEDYKIKYTSNQTESPPSVGNLARVDFPVKETSKDGLSAGSFTEETQTDWSPECQIPAVVSTQEEINSKHEGENATSRETFVGCTLKKRRGKRKRKVCSNNMEVKDGVAKENEVGSSIVKEESTGDCDRTGRSSNVVDRNDSTVGDEFVDLMSILNTFMENENASVFRRRLDSQRKTRYRKTIRRHLDLNTIRSRVSDRTITSARELFRDLLLLCNNAIVFYPKDSRQHKSAISLRDLVTKTFRQNLRVSGKDSALSSVLPTEQPVCILPPVKPRSARSGSRKVNGKVVAEVILSRETKKACKAEIPTESTEVVKKKGVERPGKVGRSGGRKRIEAPANGRKRGRKR